MQKQQPSLQEQLKEQDQIAKNSNANPEKTKKLNANLEEKRVHYNKAFSEFEELQEKIDIINREIKEKTDKKLSGVNKNIKENTNVLEKCKAELVKLKVEIKTSER